MSNLRFAFRQLRKNPGFTAVAVLSLALGIGANSTIFALVNDILFRPLPYDAPDRLVVIWETHPTSGVKRAGPSGPDYLDWMEQSRSFEVMAAFDHGSGTVTGPGEPEQVAGMRVTVNFFGLLGTQPWLGRTFLPEEGHGGRHNTLVVTHGYWQRRFGADPNILGRKVTLDGLTYEVAGVLPANFYFPVPSEVFVPWDDDELRRKDRTALELGVVGRLKPGVTAPQAESDLNVVAGRISALDAHKRGWGVTVVPLKQAMFASVQPALWVLLGAVGFVLAIACANVANLLLTRATGRRREIAIRLAVGAGRWRIVRQLLTESLLLAALGGAAGLGLSAWGLDVLRAVLPGRVPVPDAAVDVLLRSYGIDGAAFTFTLGLCAVCGIAFGLVPALQATGADLTDSLKAGGRAGAGASRGRTRSALVVVQVALSLVLLSGVGLMLETLPHLRAVNPGFRTDHELAMEIELPTDSKYQEKAGQSQFFRQTLEEVARVPGVQSAGLVECLPLDEQSTWRDFRIEGRPLPAPGQEDRAEYRRVSAGYFATLGIPLVQGRCFTDQDDERAPLVAVIDRALARRYWPGEDPVGQRLFIADGQSRSRAIVGVVGGIHHFGLSQGIDPLIYVPFPQQPASRMTLIVRTDPAPGTLVRPVKEAIWRVDRDQPVYKVRTLDQLPGAAVAVPRMTLDLLGGFAFVALALAAVGIYGVMAYAVAQRTHEIGIRLALGARRADVFKLIVRSGIGLSLLGIAIGVAGGLGLTRVIASQLYGVKAADPFTFARASLLLLIVALLACWWPARRAARVNPMRALRTE